MLELFMCKRYYQTSYEFGVFPGTGGGVATNTIHRLDADSSNAGLTIHFEPSMRVTPTLSLWSPNGTANKFRDYFANADFDVSNTELLSTRSAIVSNSGHSMVAGVNYGISWAAEAELI
jgi:hypothetical protein